MLRRRAGRRKPSTVWAATALAGALLLAACGGGDGDGGGGGDARGKRITVWTLEDVADRIAATKRLVAEFSQKSGVQVEVVAVAEDQFNQLVTGSAAAGELPDVIGALSLAGVRSLASNALLDTETPGQIVDALGRDTFSERALELTAQDDAQLAVPSDGWAQLIFYRKDLYDRAGLQPPTTYEALLAAAKQLNGRDRAGIAVATAPSDTFTQQTFEHIALANGCQLTDDGGNVTLDSEQCVAAFQFFDDLVTQGSTRGSQDVDTTRAAYFAGKAAAVIWSSFLLDEMAGLRKDALPTCPECRREPLFLAKNSGVVSALSGPDGEPAQYGEITSWVLTGDAEKDASRQFVEFMMGEGYERWLGLAPEGKVPTRSGTKESPEEYAEAWARLPSGVDTKKPLADIYPQETIDELVKSVDTFSRWGLNQNQGSLVGAILGELPVPKALSDMVNGSAEAQDAATRAKQAVESVKSGLD